MEQTISISIHRQIRERFSPMAFSDQPVSTEILVKLFEAARWAASSFNEQPWRYVFATKAQPEAYQLMLDAMLPGNQEWAHTAPVLLVSIAKKEFTQNGQPNRHAFHDVGAASTQLSIEATALGLQVHQMAGFDAEKIKQSLQVPDGFEVVAMMAVGYPGDTSGLSERMQKRAAAPRTRKPMEELFFSGRFGEGFNG